MSFAKSLCIAGMLSALGGPVASAEALNDAVANALATHPSVAGAAVGVQAMQEEKKAQVSGYFPTVNLSASTGRIFANNSTSRGLSVVRGEGYSWLGQGGVTVRQMIFDGLETPSRVGAASADVKAAEMDLLDARDTLAMQTVQAYISLLRAREGLKMLQGQQASVKSYLDRIEGMVNEGASDEAELQQALDVQAILDNYTADYEGQVRSLEADYLALTGHMPDNALSVPMLRKDIIPASIDAAIEVGKTSHPQIKSASFVRESASKNVKAEKGTLYPDLTGELSYDVLDQRDVIGGESEDARALLRLNWDLETGGGQLARIRERGYEEKQAALHVNELQRGVERSVRQAYSELATASKQLENQNARVELNKKLLDVQNTQFEAAKISLLQLMQSDNQLLITKLEQLNAQNRVLMAKYNILAAMGQVQPALNVNLAQAVTK
jgi:adhesin transport system outer membrane protein